MPQLQQKVASLHSKHVMWPNNDKKKMYRQSLRANTHTQTHPFNGPLSRTVRVGRYQKGKTNLDFTEARDSEWQWHQLDQSAPRSRGGKKGKN